MWLKGYVGGASRCEGEEEGVSKVVSDGGCWFVKVVSLKGDKGEVQWLLWRWKKVKFLVVWFY